MYPVYVRGEAYLAAQLVRWFGAICAGNCVEQLAAACEGGFPSSVCEQAEVADADQTFGQNVEKKPAQELVCCNCHDRILAAMGIVSPAEGDATVLEGHEAMVGDGDAMGVAGQVVANLGIENIKATMSPETSGRLRLFSRGSVDSLTRSRSKSLSSESEGRPLAIARHQNFGVGPLVNSGRPMHSWIRSA